MIPFTIQSGQTVNDLEDQCPWQSVVGMGSDLIGLSKLGSELIVYALGRTGQGSRHRAPSVSLVQ